MYFIIYRKENLKSWWDGKIENHANNMSRDGVWYT